MSQEQVPHDAQVVPGTGGAPADTRDGQRALRLHSVIAVIAFVLCAFVSAVFFWMDTLVQGVIFAVLALACLGILFWAQRTRRGVLTRR